MLFDDGVLLTFVLVFVGLALLGSVFMLLFWVAGMLTPSLTISCPEFEQCSVPAPDGNESVSVDDAVSGGPSMTP